MNPIAATVFRSLFKLAAGALIARGLLDDSQAEAATGAALTLFSVVWGIVAAARARKSQSPQAGADSRLKSIIPAFVLLASIAGLTLSTGCARFTTKQTDTSYDSTGKPLRTITTTAKATTLFEARSQLANFKASQTDKSQSATVGSLNQEAQATNSAAAAGAFLGELIKAAK